jgi:RND family efflux transporter MFP subunit
MSIVIIVVIQLRSNKNLAQKRVYQYDKEQAINVQALTLSLQDAVADYWFTGNFEPDKETKISAEIQGKINKIYTDAGHVVRKGQALIQLDNSLLKLQLEAVEVQIEGLEADVKRYGILAKADAIQGVQLEKAELGLKAAKVQRSTILEQINKTTIVAPFDGIVTAKLTEEGAFAAPGMPLLQITDIARLKFTVMVSENDLKLFRVNQSYPVIADVYPETILSGKASLIGSKANMGSSFPVQIAVHNTSDLKIKSGMFGKMTLSNNEGDKQIIIPASAIVGSTVQPQVYIIKNGKAILQSILVGERMGNEVVVQSGLREGDMIVSGGFINLFDGANVEIKN